MYTVQIFLPYFRLLTLLRNKGVGRCWPVNEEGSHFRGNFANLDTHRSSVKEVSMLNSLRQVQWSYVARGVGFVR